MISYAVAVGAAAARAGIPEAIGRTFERVPRVATGGAAPAGRPIVTAGKILTLNQPQILQTAAEYRASISKSLK